MKPLFISIGYGRHLFDPENGERKRQAACAQETAGLHMIVFSLRTHGLQDENDGMLFLYPTRSYSRILMIVDAVRIGLRIMRTDIHKKKASSWNITSQDPLAAGIVGYVLARTTGSPFVVQEHGDIFSGDYWRRESTINSLLFPIARFIVKRADFVRVVSMRVKEHVMALGVSESRIRTLAVFSDLASIRTAPIRTDLRSTHSTASVIVLSVARFVAQKNLFVLLRAFKKLHAHTSSAKLVLVGRGDEEQPLKAEALQLGIAEAIAWLPWSNDVASLMKSADIYALSSNYEGWARVLPEAMAAGLPAVSTDVGCAGEVFIHEHHGLVVPVGDESLFGSALIALASDREKGVAFAAAGQRDAEALSSDQESYARAWVSAHTAGQAL